MNLALCPRKEDPPRAGQLKLLSFFAIMAVIGVFLAWHRQFWQFHEYDKCRPSVTLIAMGLPLAILLSGVWPRLREPLFAVAPIVVLGLCLSYTWTTVDTFMHISPSSGPNEYTIYGGDIFWGSFLWGFGLPAAMTSVAAAFEVTRREFKTYKYSILTSSIAILNTVAASLFVILLCTAKTRDVDAFVEWTRSVTGYRQ